MQKELKEKAAKALGQVNLFTESVIREYLNNDAFKYKYKEALVKILQGGKVVIYATTLQEDLLNDITARRRQQYQNIRLLQLKEIEAQTEGCLKSWCRVLIALNDGSTILEREKFQNMANRQELKLIKAFSRENADIDEIKKFLLVSLLFSQRTFRYEKEDVLAYCALCNRIA